MHSWLLRAFSVPGVLVLVTALQASPQNADLRRVDNNSQNVIVTWEATIWEGLPIPWAQCGDTASNSDDTYTATGGSCDVSSPSVRIAESAALMSARCDTVPNGLASIAFAESVSDNFGNIDEIKPYLRSEVYTECLGRGIGVFEVDPFEEFAEDPMTLSYQLSLIAVGSPADVLLEGDYISPGIIDDPGLQLQFVGTFVPPTTDGGFVSATFLSAQAGDSYVVAVYAGDNTWIIDGVLHNSSEDDPEVAPTEFIELHLSSNLNEHYFGTQVTNTGDLEPVYAPHWIDALGFRQMSLFGMDGPGDYFWGIHTSARFSVVNEEVEDE